ncbi:thioredoxin family protein [Chryseobacterium sp. CT-SW4]|uniref:thioredoxin family protein n=1 Tax=Chryseobacterium sp. SW-1 TaxID=3157343 RepID=UPI003B01B3F4
MKFSKIILLFTVLLFQVGFAQEKADVILKKALTQAGSENKNVLLVFHASWCRWCKLMEKNMNLPETRPLFEKNYVTAYIDVQERGDKKTIENPGGQELMNRFKGESAGLPFWVILNSKGEILTNSFNEKGENLGSPSTRGEVDTFIGKLEQSSTLNKEELEVIYKTFLNK